MFYLNPLFLVLCIWKILCLCSCSGESAPSGDGCGGGLHTAMLTSILGQQIKQKNSLSKGRWKWYFSILSELEDRKHLHNCMRKSLQCLLLQSVTLWTGKSSALRCCFVVLHCPSLTNGNPKYLMERNEIKRRKTAGWLAKKNKRCCQESNWTEKGNKWGR